jgi:hypothetical protein
LSYGARGGLIEPLAKAGQLRAVVATTGLAAGVNFSMRSVLVTDTRYSVRHFERHLLPEELLQMFGRAGRRGLDENGYVLVAPGRPRLEDARPRNLKRATQIDWPTLAGVMEAARERGAAPLAAAAELCARLFSQQEVPLGVERSVADGPRPCGLFVDAERSRLAQPQSVEMLNSRQEWEPLAPELLGTLESVWVRVDSPTGESPAAVPAHADPAAPAIPARAGPTQLPSPAHPVWRPAMQDATFMRGIGHGNLCKLPCADGPWRYGRELPLAVVLEDRGAVRLVKGLRATLGTLGEEWRGRNYPPGGRMGWAAFEERLLPLVPVLSAGGTFHRLVERGGILLAQADYATRIVPARLDAAGRALHAPLERRNYPACCQGCPQLPVCEAGSKELTPALAWRKLGLIDPDGTPTRRGVIFSFFHHGEGLAIAAALEQGADFYPIDELVYDLANLRAGYRFAAEGENPHGGRLGILCARVYARGDYPGYLELGVPPDYGDGAAEVVNELELHPANRQRLLNESLRAGDLERALTEWRSLLLHITAAPDYPWDRWRELQAAARAHVERAVAVSSLPVFPPLSAAQQRRYHHRLFLK